MAPSSKKVVLLFVALSFMIAAVHCATPAPAPAPAPSSTGSTCPIDPVKLRVCTERLNPVMLNRQCCPLLASRLTDRDAAVCLCKAFRANVPGLTNVDIPIEYVLLLCGKNVPGLILSYPCPA